MKYQKIIKMDHKYYTPDISEFHVGFEYEWERAYSTGDSTWVKHTCDVYENDHGADVIDVFRHEIINNSVRVKYLDREDIESLGWNPLEKSGKYPLGHLFELGSFTLVASIPPVEDFGGQGIHNMRCEIKISGDTVFDGFIKNKSELKKIMKQLEIL